MHVDDVEIHSQPVSLNEKGSPIEMLAIKSRDLSRE